MNVIRSYGRHLRLFVRFFLARTAPPSGPAPPRHVPRRGPLGLTFSAGTVRLNRDAGNLEWSFFFSFSKRCGGGGSWPTAPVPTRWAREISHIKQKIDPFDPVHVPSALPIEHLDDRDPVCPPRKLVELGDFPADGSVFFCDNHKEALLLHLGPSLGLLAGVRFDQSSPRRARCQRCQLCPSADRWCRAGRVRAACGWRAPGGSRSGHG